MARVLPSPVRASPLLALALAACVTPPPPTPAVLSLAERACGAVPALDRALSVPLKTSSAAFQPEAIVTVDVGGETSCLQAADGARSTYVVFALPELAEGYVVSVSSAPLGTTLLSPRLMVLDARGAVLRERGREAFVFRGAVLEAGLRAYPADRFLVVASDPASIGGGASHVVGSTQSTVVPVGTGAFILFTGAESARSYVFAHNGRVIVVATPLPKVN